MAEQQTIRKESAAASAAFDALPTRERILSVCVKLFLEQGYAKTTVADIVRLAHVSNSSFQHYFRAKDGVLTELVRFMYGTQFDMAGMAIGGKLDAGSAKLPTIYIYAVETAIQIAITELNENLREIYLEAYTHQEALDYIHRSTAKKLMAAFGPYQPDLTEEDFYALDVGTAGMMRGYMACPCSDGFTLERKLRCFLSSALRALKVPENETLAVLAFVERLDVRTMAEGVMGKAVLALASHYDFSFGGPSVASSRITSQ